MMVCGKGMKRFFLRPFFASICKNLPAFRYP
jgi:hypothetical protein